MDGGIEINGSIAKAIIDLCTNSDIEYTVTSGPESVIVSNDGKHVLMTKVVDTSLGPIQCYFADSELASQAMTSLLVNKTLK